jgi:hypothetical protein
VGRGHRGHRDPNERPRIDRLLITASSPVAPEGYPFTLGNRPGGVEPQSFDVDRNLLVDGESIDPLSQTSTQSSSYVGVEPV